jgi:hypothetical protein
LGSGFLVGAALVPIETESIVKNIRRVPGTSVIAVADIKV